MPAAASDCDEALSLHAELFAKQSVQETVLPGAFVPPQLRFEGTSLSAEYMALSAAERYVAGLLFRCTELALQSREPLAQLGEPAGRKISDGVCDEAAELLEAALCRTVCPPVGTTPTLSRSIPRLPEDLPGVVKAARPGTLSIPMLSDWTPMNDSISMSSPCLQYSYSIGPSEDGTVFPNAAAQAHVLPAARASPVQPIRVLPSAAPEPAELPLSLGFRDADVALRQPEGSGGEATECQGDGDRFLLDMPAAADLRPSESAASDPLPSADEYQEDCQEDELQEEQEQQTLKTPLPARPAACEDSESARLRRLLHPRYNREPAEPRLPWGYGGSGAWGGAGIAAPHVETTLPRQRRRDSERIWRPLQCRLQQHVHNLTHDGHDAASIEEDEATAAAASRPRSRPASAERKRRGLPPGSKGSGSRPSSAGSQGQGGPQGRRPGSADRRPAPLQPARHKSSPRAVTPSTSWGKRKASGPNRPMRIGKKDARRVVPRAASEFGKEALRNIEVIHRATSSHGNEEWLAFDEAALPGAEQLPQYAKLDLWHFRQKVRPPPQPPASQCGVSRRPVPLVARAKATLVGRQRARGTTMFEGKVHRPPSKLDPGAEFTRAAAAATRPTVRRSYTRFSTNATLASGFVRIVSDPDDPFQNAVRGKMAFMSDLHGLDCGLLKLSMESLAKEHRMTTSDIAILKSIFDEFEDGDSHLNVRSFEEAVLRVMRHHLEDEAMTIEKLKQMSWWTASCPDVLESQTEGLFTFREFLGWFSSNGFNEEMLLTKDQQWLRRIAKRFEIAHDEAQYIKKLFDTSDVDKSGSIDYHEFKAIIYKIFRVPANCDLPDSRVAHFWSQIDSDCSGTAVFEEFIQWYTKYFAGFRHGKKTPLEDFYKQVRRLGDRFMDPPAYTPEEEGEQGVGSGSEEDAEEKANPVVSYLGNLDLLIPTRMPRQISALTFDAEGSLAEQQSGEHGAGLNTNGSFLCSAPQSVQGGSVMAGSECNWSAEGSGERPSPGRHEQEHHHHHQHHGRGRNWDMVAQKVEERKEYKNRKHGGGLSLTDTTRRRLPPGLGSPRAAKEDRHQPAGFSLFSQKRPKRASAFARQVSEPTHATPTPMRGKPPRQAFGRAANSLDDKDFHQAFRKGKSVCIMLEESEENGGESRLVSKDN
eukprot:TRINITY_DN14304_c0_g1_i2.p1 TRINITY_DN14304_c0_g1~~TRINITY_DN14304_c0_g1_i2.p1  ORF type:complete len:1156 (+),score=282.63 TRINITY_DN14304_c0_g1_i2:182-3649(+)